MIWFLAWRQRKVVKGKGQRLIRFQGQRGNGGGRGRAAVHARQQRAVVKDLRRSRVVGLKPNRGHGRSGDWKTTAVSPNGRSVG